MFRFPYYGYPYNYYKYYNQFDNSNFSNKDYEKDNIKQEKSSITNSDLISKTTDSKRSSNSEQAIFEIFGIKLYIDDLIILGVIYFLYQQKVHDEMLYIILFLLLFS